jgi:hypothetical protein
MSNEPAFPLKSLLKLLAFVVRILLKFLSAITFFLPYIYVLRFPILTWILLVGLPFIALFTSISSVLGNLFDLTEKGMFAFSLAAFTTSWTIMLTATLILIYSDQRFGGFAPARSIDKYRLFRWRWAIPFFTLSAVPMIWGAFSISKPFTWGKLFYTVLGLLVSLLLLLLAYVAQLWLVNPEVLKESQTLVSSYVKKKLGVVEKEPEQRQTKTRRKPAEAKEDANAKANILERLFAYLANRNPFKYASARLRNLFRNVPRKFGEGYFKYDRDEKVEAVLPNHGFALFLFTLSLVLYIFIGLMKSFNLGAGSNPNVPTLAYVLLLLMMLCWGLSGLSFFFDRYRIPVLLLFAIWMLITWLIPFGSSDRFYQVRQPQQGVISLTPGDIISRRKPSAIVVVAANGGGIQASAWAARVLTGLVEQCRADFNQDCQEFAKAIYLISSTSGGSVGSMYFVNAYSETGLPDNGTLEEKVVKKAERSSLDEVAWGLVYPDFQRALFPFITRKSDRGSALEQALAAGTELSQKSLTDWREGVRDGWRPATIFNATITETGEPFLLGTTDIQQQAKGFQANGFIGKNFGDYYPGLDMSVVTAARLSASFPYVSPAARADNDGLNHNQLHVVDGGYYDNYGMSSLAAWLDQALKTDGNEIKHVLVIQIHGAPTSPARDDHLGGYQSWLFQTYAPLSTIVGVRDGGQISHNNIEFNLLKRVETAEKTLEIDSALFQFTDDGTEPPPLSWRLTQKQKDDIEKSWNLQLTGDDWATVRKFISDHLLQAEEKQ